MVKRDQIIKIKVQILSTCISWEIQLYLNIFSFYITCAISKKKKNALLLPLDSPLQWDCIWTEACRWRVKLLRSERALACLCMTAAELRSTLALCASNSAPWPDLRKTFVFPNCKAIHGIVNYRWAGHRECEIINGRQKYLFFVKPIFSFFFCFFPLSFEKWRNIIHEKKKLGTRRIILPTQ